MDFVNEILEYFLHSLSFDCKRFQPFKSFQICHISLVFLTARRRGSKKTFDGTLLLHYEKSCQNAFEQCLNLSKPPKTFKCPLQGCCLRRAAAFTESSKRICFMFTQV